MSILNTRNQAPITQLLLSVCMVAATSVGCYFLKSVFGYREIALIMLMMVSVAAMLFDIIPVLIASVFSALIWNFFFIPPLFTFHIGNTEDIMLFLLYFLIALVNGVLSIKVRQAEKRALEKEEKANSVKLYNTLLNSLSHELRTPIATIVGAVDTLQAEKSRLSADHRHILLQEIEDAGLRLNRQVDNLLNMSRLESGTLQPRLDWCDLHELITGVIQKLPAHQQHIMLHAQENLPLFRLDGGLMEQVVSNILHNAIQYTPVLSSIDVTLEHDGNLCRIMVRDEGKGFPEHQIPLVFDKFYRLPESVAGGSGLGLSIVKGYVEAHHGSIRLHNHPEGGAVFTIEIPAETTYINQLHYE